MQAWLGEAWLSLRSNAAGRLLNPPEPAAQPIQILENGLTNEGHFEKDAGDRDRKRGFLIVE